MKYPVKIILLIAMAVATIAGSSLLHYRFDFTEEGRYTTTAPTQQMVARLEKEVEVTVLLKEENMPAGFRKLANATTDFLRGLRQASNGKFRYRFVSPDEFVKDSEAFPYNDTLKTAWLRGNAVKQNEETTTGTKAVFLYPVALVKCGEEITPVNLLEGQASKGFLNPDASGLQFEILNNAEAQLEYHFAAAIQSVTQPVYPTVAYATGHGQPMGPETYALRSALSSKYRFYLIDIPAQPYISDSIQTLIIAKPTQPFAEADKLKIDQYIMRGGKVLFLLDALYAEMDSLVRSGKEFTAFARQIQLDDLLFRYGVRINADLVQDQQCDLLPQAVGSLGNQPQIELLPWPYFPLLYPRTSHPIAKSLDAVVMQFPNSIDTVRAEGVNKTILLSSGNASRRMGTPAIVTVEILKEIEKPSAFDQSNIPMAVLLEGQFKSHYANRISAEEIEKWKQMGVAFQSESSRPAKLLVTGDGDWVLNGMGREGPLPMGTNPYTTYQFANEYFLLNTIDYMNDERGIMAARSKEFVLRLLDAKKLETQKSKWQWINIGLPLVLLSLAGFILHAIRKRRYGRPLA
jgi:gliding-associated putative ABC transporter substrate-binding component GldG